MKKRILSLLLCTAMVTAVFAGCGAPASNSESSKSESSKTEESSTAESSKTEESSTAESTAGDVTKFDDVKLKMLICWNGGFKTPADQYNSDVAKAIREKVGVTVEFEEIMMNETEKLNLMFASGDMPDIINAPYWGGDAGETQVIKKAGVEGRLIDLKDLLPKYENISDMYNVGVVSQKYLENDLDYSKYNGARYILPQEIGADENNITNWGYGVFVRGDVPKALNIDPTSIKTADQLYDFMEKARDYGFKDANGNDTIVATATQTGGYAGFQDGFNSKKLTEYSQLEDGSVTYDVFTENWIEKHLFIREMIANNILDKETFKQADTQWQEKIGNGTALFTTCQYKPVIDASKLTGLYDAHPEMRYTWVGPVTYQDGSDYKQLETYGRSGSPAIIFPTSCQNVDAALTWLNYLNSEEGARLIQYGFEGDTYEMNDKGQPRMVAELSERFKTDSTSVSDELRERGIGYMQARVICGDKRMTWWGELNAFEADAQPEELTTYKTLRPIERVNGYPINGLLTGFDRYTEVAEFAFEGTTRNDYQERAYFANTEEEARQILKDYQDYLMTQDNGLFQEFLDYLSTLPATRDDIVY